MRNAPIVARMWNISRRFLTRKNQNSAVSFSAEARYKASTLISHGTISVGFQRLASDFPLQDCCLFQVVAFSSDHKVGLVNIHFLIRQVVVGTRC